MAIRCVVFDFDGVLAQSNAGKRRAYFDIFVEAAGAAPFVEQALRELPRGNRYEVIGRVLEHLRAAGRGLDGGDMAGAIQRFAADYNRLTEEHAAACPAVPGAAQALATLADSLPLYVNSATPIEPLARIVERRGWGKYFRAVLGGPQSKVDNLAEALRREGLQPGQLMFVGDTQGDREAAALCGCPFLGVQSDGNDFTAPPPELLADLTTLEARLRAAEGIVAC